jgi:peptide deformylase
MAKLEILTYPNPILREVSKPVKEFTEQVKAELKKLSEDMLETMYAVNGIGLASIQVGKPIQLLVIDTRSKDDAGRRYKYDEMTEREQSIVQPLVLINPEIIKGYGKTTFDEGCLSVPSFFDTVERFEKVDVRALDFNGKEFKLTVDGLLAICIQHEMDHLTGTLFIDHLSFLKSNKIKNQIKKSGYPDPNDKDDEDRKKSRRSKLKEPSKV